MHALPAVVVRVVLLLLVTVSASPRAAGAQQLSSQVFPSLESARAHVASVKATTGLPVGGLVVQLAGGRHLRTTSFQLTAADSGTAGSPVIYRSAPSADVAGVIAKGSGASESTPVGVGRARIIGGVPLDVSGFTPVTAASPVWPRIDPLAQGQVLQFSLLAAGVSDYGSLGDNDHGIELSFNGVLMQLARWPNVGDPLPAVVSAESATSYRYSGSRPQRWLTAPDPWAWGLWFYNWRDNHEPMASIDVSQQSITLGGTPDYGIAAGQTWYAENLLEELDLPGEWYVDRTEGVLYFWPPGALGGAEVMVSTLTAPLVDVQGASYVTFEDLVFELGQQEALAVSNGREVIFRRCEIRNTGTWGARISGTGCGLERCLVHHTGGRGVDLDGGDRFGLTGGGLFVRDSQLHHFGSWRRTYAPAVRLLGSVPSGGSADQRGVGCSVIGNWIHDGPHSAIMYGGNNNRIELNTVHDVCQRTDDTGAIYSGRDWGSRGNIVRFNFVHDIANDLSLDRTHGVYLDDCDSGDLIYGNVFYRVAGRAVMVGGGRDNVLQNNVIAQCGAAFYTDRRGTVSINSTPGSSFNLLAKIQEFHYTQPPWSEAYPSLAAILDGGYAAALEPQGNAIIDNLGWQNGIWLQEGSFGGSGGFSFFSFGDNIADADPLFVDEQNLDLSLSPGSPAFSMPGFQDIPFARIGSKGW